MSKSGRYSADRKKIEDLTAAKTVEVHDCGTVFTLSLAAGFAVVLPDAQACGPGWWCKFIVKVAPTGGDYTVDASAGDANNMHGLGLTSEDDQGTPSHTNGTAIDQAALKQNKAKIGDQLELVTDGSLWYVTALVQEHDAIIYG
jgi:hypothetical protein